MSGRATGEDAWAGEDERPGKRRRGRTARAAAAGFAVALAVTGVAGNPSAGIVAVIVQFGG